MTCYAFLIVLHCTELTSPMLQVVAHQLLEIPARCDLFSGPRCIYVRLVQSTFAAEDQTHPLSTVKTKY